MIKSKRLPQGWASTKLGEICSIEMGQSPPSASYNTEGIGLPFFQGKTEFRDVYPITVKWCDSPLKIAQKDDILLSIRAPVGPTNLAPSQCCIGRGLASLTPCNGVEVKFIMYLLRHSVSSLDSLGTGTTFKAISSKTVQEFKICIASTNEQRLIVKKIEELFSYLDSALVYCQH